MGVYTRNPDFKSGKEIREAFAAGQVLNVYQPGLFGPTVKDGSNIIEGPAFQPHRFYVGVTIKDGVVTHVHDPKNPKKAFTFVDGELMKVNRPEQS